MKNVKLKMEAKVPAFSIHVDDYKKLSEKLVQTNIRLAVKDNWLDPTLFIDIIAKTIRFQTTC